MMIDLPKLPYAEDALEPNISAEIIKYHYGKHHRAYVNNLNKLIKGTTYENKSLKEIIKLSSGPIYDNAAQVYNHTFYWNSMTPNYKELDTEHELYKLVVDSFGSIDNLLDELKQKAVKLFGSGWVWLVVDESKKQLSLHSTTNANTPYPIAAEGIPLLCVDVWEHAYYLEYKNDRAEYLDNFVKIINWDFAEENYKNV